MVSYFEWSDFTYLVHLKWLNFYQSVWMDDGSPLMVYSRRQQAVLQQALQVYSCIRYDVWLTEY